MRNNVNAAESLEGIQKDYDSEVAKYNSAKEAYEKKSHTYYRKQKQVKNAVQQWVENKIFTSCSAQFMKDTDITVNVDQYSNIDKNWNMLEIRVKHEGEHGFRTGDNIALKWEWDIEIHDSFVKQSTNSYSGLNLVTKSNLKELKESVDVMEKLAAIPDSDFIKLRSKANSELPDMLTDLGPEPTRVDNNSFFWRKVAALAGTDQAVETERYVYSYKSSERNTIYYQIVKVTEKSVVVNELIEYPDEVRMASEGKRMSKQKFADNVVRPLNIVDVLDV